MNLDPQMTLAVGLPSVAGLIWLIRLEGRVNLGEERHRDIKEDLADIRKEVHEIGTYIRNGGLPR